MKARMEIRTDPGPTARARVARRAWLEVLSIVMSVAAPGCNSSGGGSGEARTFRVVEVGSKVAPAERLAVQACAGLSNREHGGSVYTRLSDKDDRWLEELDLEPEATLDAAAFLDECLERIPRCVRYSYATQQRLLPNVLTVGTVLGALPLDEGLAGACEEVVFDAIEEFRERSAPAQATQYVYDAYVDETTGLAMLNPGYDQGDKTFWNPALSRDPNSDMVDFVFSEKLFVSFLINGCIDGTEDSAVLEQVTLVNPWAKPIGVYGYANYWLVLGGFLFEAQTRCVSARNMGAIPTETNNLSFFSTRRRPIESPGALVQNKLEPIDYDPGRTYVAFVVGDGDNVRFIMDSRSRWLRQRLDDCERDARACAPITWTMSPQLPRLAPDVLEWYYEQSLQTGNDYFMLPPSGSLYAYPASLEAGAQDAFVAETERAAAILGTGSTVHWEWFDSWRSAETEFLPKYARRGLIGGAFPVNVPYMFPTFTGWKRNQFYKVLSGVEGGDVILFRPREWRGVDNSGTDLLEPFSLSPDRMAAELAGYPRGTVAAVYMTSDGGLDLSNSFTAMIEHLPPHVTLVSGDTAVRLAREASAGGS